MNADLRSLSVRLHTISLREIIVGYLVFISYIIDNEPFEKAQS